MSYDQPKQRKNWYNCRLVQHPSLKWTLWLKLASSNSVCTLGLNSHNQNPFKGERSCGEIDKIFTNVERWYKNPLILPAVSNSDHFSVIFQPTLSPPPHKGHRIFYYRRSCNPMDS